MVFGVHSLLSDESGVVGLDRHLFPPPWTVDEQSTCFVVQDHSGQVLAYIYYKEPDRRSAAKLPTKDDARRIADNFAKLPELLWKL
jgi:hypothetical protein